ncbi:UNC-like C-terminal-domain-containing protein [Gorgonomyces haynaldii]|nr:UNC-like C-terminal-domain-containing protein [Gorgonomyces haynaldii]
MNMEPFSPLESLTKNRPKRKQLAKAAEEHSRPLEPLERQVEPAERQVEPEPVEEQPRAYRLLISGVSTVLSVFAVFFWFVSIGGQSVVGFVGSGARQATIVFFRHRIYIIVAMLSLMWLIYVNKPVEIPVVELQSLEARLANLESKTHSQDIHNLQQRVSEVEMFQKQLLNKIESLDLPETKMVEWMEWLNLNIDKMTQVPTLEQIQQLIHQESGQIKQMVEGLVEKQEYPDYALNTAGATIDYKFTTQTYSSKSSLHQALSLVGFERRSHGPDTVLDPGVLPGQCWPMKGSKGSVGIHLVDEIIPQTISIEHASVQVLYGNKYTSAPRKMVVKSLPDMQVLAQFEFDPKQGRSHFPLVATKTRSIQVVVESNWGHPDWTCIYKIRIH